MPTSDQGAPSGALARAFDDAASINAFFNAPAPAAPAQTRPLADFWNDHAYLELQVDSVRQRLAARAGIAPDAVEPRVAASLLFQGSAARILSPAIAALLCHGLLPAQGSLGWYTDSFGSLALARIGDESVRITPGQEADAMDTRILQQVLAPAVAALSTRVKVAPRLLWGNAASALAATLRELATARPAVRPRADALGRDLLTRAPLQGLGAPSPGHTPTGHFVRTTCCLYYRLPGFGECGDCALIKR